MKFEIGKPIAVTATYKNNESAIIIPEKPYEFQGESYYVLFYFSVREKFWCSTTVGKSHIYLFNKRTRPKKNEKINAIIAIFEARNT